MSAKLHRCDGCGKDRRDVQSVGRDANGDPDAPDLCFFCRKRQPRLTISDVKDAWENTSRVISVNGSKS